MSRAGTRLARTLSKESDDDEECDADESMGNKILV